MKKSIFILFILFSLFLYPKNKETELDSLFPKISEKVDNIEELIPEGWECIQKDKGDLNKDKQDDVVVILEKKDEEKLITYSVYNGNEKTLNFNPRVIIVLFKEKNGKYTVASKNTKDFIKNKSSHFTRDKIPTQDELNEYYNFFNDPFGGVSIKRNTLHIYFDYDNYLSENDSGEEYIFRYQNGKFELIGYGTTTISYGTYIENETNNYSTGKKKIEIIENDKVKEVKWEKVKNPKLTLDNIE